MNTIPLPLPAFCNNRVTNPTPHPTIKISSNLCLILDNISNKKAPVSRGLKRTLNVLKEKAMERQPAVAPMPRQVYTAPQRDRNPQP
jgi:hypothetical protein